MSTIESDPRLSRAVQHRADVERLSPDDRRTLAAWLDQARPTPAQTPRARRRRVLTIATGAAVVLVPWLAYLAATLPDRHRAREWWLAWVGFDGALVVAFAATAWFGWRNRQVVVTAFLVTATLLLCDAWFDVVLSWGGNEQTASIITALVGEVPFAVFLLTVYHRLIRTLSAQSWRDRGRTSDPPSMWRMPLMIERPDTTVR